MRKFFAASICAAMLVSCAAGTAVTASADETNNVSSVLEKNNVEPSSVTPTIVKKENGWVYGFLDGDNDTAGIYDYRGTEEVVIIPSVINGHRINRIFTPTMAIGEIDGYMGGPFSNNTTIRELTIPESVEYIGGSDYEGERAFENCTNLTKVVIPASVTSISEGSFTNCPNLTIYGVRGSVAEDYALRNQIPFAVSSSTAANTQTNENSSNTSPVTSNTSVTRTAPDFEEYFATTVRNANGSADTSDKTATISVDNINDSSWSSRSGNLGYTVDDFNNDGKDEMIVYSLSEHSLWITTYTADDNGQINPVDRVLIFEEYNATADYCVGEFVEISGKKYLLFEEFNNASFFSNGENVRYNLYEMDSRGNLVMKSRIGMDGAASSPIKYYLTTYSGDTAVKKEIWDNDANSGVSRKQALQSALKEIGLPETNKTSVDVLELMGYKNYNKTYMQYPTYFFDNSTKVLFNLVNAPVDFTTRTDGKYKFKSTVRKYSSTASANGNTNGTTGNTTSSNTSSTPTSPKTGVQNHFGLLMSALLASGAAVAFAGRKSKEDN